VRLLGLPPKLRLAPLWPALAAVITAAIFLGSLLPSLLERTASVQLFDMLDLVAPIARERLANPRLNLETWAVQLAADSGIRVTLIRRDGVVLADSSVEPDQVRAMFWGLGADGTVSANKNSINSWYELMGIESILHEL